jgi:hypothetical protein
MRIDGIDRRLWIQQQQHMALFISSRYKKKGVFKVNLLLDMILNVLKFKYTIMSIYLVYIL